MERVSNNEPFYASSRQQWRRWLQKNHRKNQSVWLVMYKKDAGTPTVSRSHSVDEALCFGWIDSTCRKIDEECFVQLFTRRKPTSV